MHAYITQYTILPLHHEQPNYQQPNCYFLGSIIAKWDNSFPIHIVHVAIIHKTGITQVMQ